MKSKGITLIALVITVVVLIILAAVAINLSLGSNGIFNRVKTAKEQYSNAESKEQTDITVASNQIDGLIGGNREDEPVFFQEERGNVSIPAANTSYTLKEFTNLTPGYYYVEYFQCTTVGVTGWCSIKLNENILAHWQNTCNNGSTINSISAIAHITNTSDIIKLTYASSSANTSSDRPYYCQIMKIR